MIESNKRPSRRFTCQRSNAKRRGIEWNLTFDEWWSVWESSGKFDMCGKTKGTFQMDRIDPSIGYCIGNVQIVDGATNRTKDSPHGHNAKLTEGDVGSIKRRFIPRVVTKQMLADEYGVTKSCIKLLLSGINWKSVGAAS